EIKNNCDYEVQLLSRYWHIQDGDGNIEEIRGSGVIGLQPVIKSGENFEYSSFCPLKTPFGMMSGAYQMKINPEETFEATIPAFSLSATDYVN
ncbi:MAG: Co2+/Mg2+ efflux protein ApaG, partial [Candidatus Neomarinimicrobiota bacterium]